VLQDQQVLRLHRVLLVLLDQVPQVQQEPLDHRVQKEPQAHKEQLAQQDHKAQLVQLVPVPVDQVLKCLHPVVRLQFLRGLLQSQSQYLVVVVVGLVG